MPYFSTDGSGSGTAIDGVSQPAFPQLDPATATLRGRRATLSLISTTLRSGTNSAPASCGW